MAQILGQILNNSSHPKNELRERSRWDIKSRWFLHVRRWFFFINHLRADTGKNFLIKATLGLKIPKKNFNFCNPTEENGLITFASPTGSNRHLLNIFLKIPWFLQYLVRGEYFSCDCISNSTVKLLWWPRPMSDREWCIQNKAFLSCLYWRRKTFLLWWFRQEVKHNLTSKTKCYFQTQILLLTGRIWGGVGISEEICRFQRTIWKSGHQEEI